ncbi:hypothetical protein KM043_004223 [Ampulex compressa]|nr:hypothetical protein KM043_004223 [Ampulex compressa]
MNLGLSKGRAKSRNASEGIAWPQRIHMQRLTGPAAFPSPIAASILKVIALLEGSNAAPSVEILLAGPNFDILRLSPLATVLLNAVSPEQKRRLTNWELNNTAILVRKGGFVEANVSPLFARAIFLENAYRLAARFLFYMGHSFNVLEEEKRKKKLGYVWSLSIARTMSGRSRARSFRSRNVV